MRWFRIYSEARTDAKLESLTDAQHRVWFRLMCFAGDQSERGEIVGYDEELLAVEVARGDVDLLRSTLERLVKLRIVSAGDCVAFLNWEKRQYDKPSDSPEQTRERKRKSRAPSIEEQSVTPMSRAVTPHRAETELEAETETDTEAEVGAAAARAPDVELSPAERQVVTYIQQVPGMAAVGEAEIVSHLRDVLSVHDPPPSQKSVLADAIRFRDNWTEKRSDAPEDERWRGWRQGITNWFSRTKEDAPARRNGASDPNQRTRDNYQKNLAIGQRVGTR